VSYASGLSERRKLYKLRGILASSTMGLILKTKDRRASEWAELFVR
jgi:hypothetical protein